MEEQEKRFKKDEKNGNNLGETQTLSVKILLDNDYVDALNEALLIISKKYLLT